MEKKKKIKKKERKELTPNPMGFVHINTYLVSLIGRIVFPKVGYQDLVK